ncbi:MAG: transporter substrate-binding domain-containing protein [Aliidongia sp.]
MKRTWIATLVLLMALTQAEARPFIVAGGSDVAPYQFTGTDGHATGILVYLYGECFRRLGIEFEYETYPWARAQERVQAGEADAMSTVVTDKRLIYAVPGAEHLAVERLVAFATRTNPHFDEIMAATSIDDLKGLHALAQVGSGWTEQNLPKSAIVYGGSPADLLVMLAAGRADLLIEDEALTQLRLQTLRGQYPDLQFDSIVAARNALATLEFHMMVSKKSGYLNRLKDIDRTMAEMRQDGTIHRIYGNFGIDDLPAQPPPASASEPLSPSDAPAPDVARRLHLPRPSSLRRLRSRSARGSGRRGRSGRPNDHWREASAGWPN